MQTQTTSGDDRFDVEDVAAAIREGRSLRPAALYRIVVLDDQLHERHVDLSDPVPTGRQNCCFTCKYSCGKYFR